LNLYIRTIERLSNLMAGLSALVLAAMALLILAEILLWNTLQKTTLVADEYSAYGLAAIIFLGAGYCLKERGHIRITLLLTILPQKISRIISALATALTTVFMGYLWWYLFLMVRSSYRYHSTSGTLTNTLLWIPQSLMLLGATCFFLQLTATTLAAFRAIKTGEQVL
jgi:TRAP-type C4-dicarboxylate transport system permease small subunit